MFIIGGILDYGSQNDQYRDSFHIISTSVYVGKSFSEVANNNARAFEILLLEIIHQSFEEEIKEMELRYK